MDETRIAEILLELAVLLALTYLLAGLLARIRIPTMLSALLVAMAAHYTPIGERLLSPDLYPTFNFLAELGVLFLLFLIGLQIDLKEMRALGDEIVWCTILNTSVPFLLGVAVMLAMGYDWVLAFVVGMTRMPTAEAVIVPILDEFQLIRTRVGELIVGVGTLDDIIEVLMVSIVSVWIARGATAVESEILSILLSLLIFCIAAWFSYKALIPWLSRWLPRRTRNLMMLSVLVLFAMGGYTEYSHLGTIVGAIIAGVIMRPIINEMGNVGDQLAHAIQSISYGFLGLIFFLWVGLSVDLEGLFQSPTLAIMLYLASGIGKLLGVYAMVPMKKLSIQEASIIGVGLSAQLTTEIIVAKMLLEAKLIDIELFTAMVTASSFSVITVPVLLSLLLRHWGKTLLTKPETLPKETTHAK
jgi:Ca2+-transporting ATPase